MNFSMSYALQAHDLEVKSWPLAMILLLAPSMVYTTTTMVKEICLKASLYNVFNRMA